MSRPALFKIMEKLIIVNKKKFLKANMLHVIKNTGTHFYVKAGSVDGWYSVRYYSRLNSFGCSCEDHMRRRHVCKHIIAVMRQHAKNIKIEFEAEKIPA